jgi:hypothetical protein
MRKYSLIACNFGTIEGIAMGDPIADCLNVIITRDGEIHGEKYLK